MSMWEPFTEHARRTVVLANMEAARLGREDTVEIEDLLLGIIAEGQSAGSRLLAAKGVELESARHVVRDCSPALHDAKSKTDAGADYSFSPGAKRVVEAAFVEARSFQHHYISPEHLLLAILRVNETTKSAAIIQICGDSAGLRSALVKALSEQPPRAGSTAQTAGLRQSADVPGTSMWEPFTEDARNTIVGAQNAAGERMQNFIGNEHILLGMMKLKNGPAYEALSHAGVTAERLGSAVNQVSAQGSSAPQEMVFTTGAKRAIEEAFAAARMLDQRSITSGHLLLGTLVDSDVAGRIFDVLALNKEALKNDVIARLLRP